MTQAHTPALIQDLHLTCLFWDIQGFGTRPGPVQVTSSLHPSLPSLCAGFGCAGHKTQCVSSSIFSGCSHHHPQGQIFPTPVDIDHSLHHSVIQSFASSRTSSTLTHTFASGSICFATSLPLLNAVVSALSGPKVSTSTYLVFAKDQLDTNPRGVLNQLVGFFC